MSTTLHSEAVIPLFGELSPSECEGLLSGHYVGRLAFSLHDRVNVLPVHYVYSGGWIYGRSAPGGKLLQILRNRWVAFEVDSQDGMFDWKSVVAHGALYVIEPARNAREHAVYERALVLLRELIPETMAIGDPVPFRNQLFRIHVAEMTGRFSVSHGGDAFLVNDEFRPDPADATADARLNDEVSAAIAPFLHTSGTSIHVDVYEGTVVLGGWVGDARGRAAIEAAVVHLPGVHALVQQLETKWPDVSEQSPVELAASAVRSLRTPSLPEASNVTVVVDHGWLRVEGSVKSTDARVEIRRRVERLPGTRGFVDRLTLT